MKIFYGFILSLVLFGWVDYDDDPILAIITKILGAVVMAMTAILIIT